jgi:nucleotide-binding universal stress UspA family protein
VTEAQDRSTPRIVVGIDGSEPSRHALRWAGAFAAATGARIDVVTAWQLPTTLGYNYPPAAFNEGQDYEKILGEIVDEVFGGDRPAGMRLRVREGAPAHVLLDVSRDATMIVVGGRGHGGFRGLLLGSVSTKVAEHATCPVLIIHGDGPPPVVQR